MGDTDEVHVCSSANTAHGSNQSRVKGRNIGQTAIQGSGLCYKKAAGYLNRLCTLY